MSSESFPWNRYRAAERYLYAVKPYWARYGARFKVVPIDVPAPPGGDYGAMTSTDEAFNLYVDGSFARRAPLEVLAGAIEHELRYHVQDYFGRMRFADRDRASQFKKLSFELEVNETIQAENASIDGNTMNSILHNSPLFTHREYAQRGVSGPPDISDLAWTPERLGLEKGLTAEEYFSSFKRALRDERDQETGGAADPGEGGGEDVPDGGGDQSDDDSAQDQGDGDTQEEMNGADSGESPESGGDPQDDDQLDLGDLLLDYDAPEDSDAQDGSGPGEGDPQEDDPAGEGEAGGGESHQDDGEPQEDEGSPQGDSTDGEGQTQEDKPDGPDGPASPGQSDQDMDGSGESPLDLVKDIIDDVPSMSWWARDTDPQNFMDSDQEANDEVPDEWDEREWMRELAEDVKDAQHSTTGNNAFGVSPGDSLVKVVDDVIRRTKGSGYEELRRVISSSVSTSHIKGSSDVSYQVRNPNQPSIGVVLMGSFSYAPAISVVIDVSHSMRRFLDVSLEALRDIIVSAVGMYGDQVNWLSVDSDVIDMGRAVNVSRNTLDRVARGFGGTVLAPTMQALANGTFRKGRNRLPRQDVVVVITDGGFSWPWKEEGERPPAKTTFIIVHPRAVDIDDRLPKWVTKRPHVVMPTPL